MVMNFDLIVSLKFNKYPICSFFRVASHARSFKKVVDNWLGLITHMKSIYERETDDFEEDVKTKAKTHFKFLTNRNSMALLWFCLDVLNILSRFSVLSQRQYSTIIDQVTKVNITVGVKSLNVSPILYCKTHFEGRDVAHMDRPHPLYS